MEDAQKQSGPDLNAIYADRARAVQLAARLAMMIPGFEAGVRTDELNPEWPVVAIDIPGHGEVAWHIHGNDLVLCKSYEKPYDGHTDEEKAKRIQDFCKS